MKSTPVLLALMLGACTPASPAPPLIASSTPPEIAQLEQQRAAFEARLAADRTRQEQENIRHRRNVPQYRQAAHKCMGERMAAIDSPDLSPVEVVRLAFAACRPQWFRLVSAQQPDLSFDAQLAQTENIHQSRASEFVEALVTLRAGKVAPAPVEQRTTTTPI